MEDYYDFALNEKACALINDDGESIELIAMNLTTNSTIKKQFSYEDDVELEDGRLLEASVVIEDDIIVITIPDGTKQEVKIS